MRQGPELGMPSILSFMVWIDHQQRLPSSLYDLRRDFLELCERSIRAPNRKGRIFTDSLHW